jgi:hypothetical protein
MIKMNKKQPQKIKLLIPLLIVGLLSIVLLYYMNKKDGVSDISGNTNGLSYPGPTEQEKRETEENKKEVENRENLETVSRDSQKTETTTVTPIISSWGQDQASKNVEVGAFVPGVYEDGGKCTLTLTNQGVIITEVREGAKNVSNTTCGIFTVKRDRVTAGSWSAVVQYSSSKATGTSSQINVTVE